MGGYIKQLYDFLREVRENNNRVWLADNKHRYDELRALWMDDVDRLIGHMTAWEPDMATQTSRSAAYRFYRDTRFSTDKTPYKTFFSALLSPYGRKTDHAAYYLHMGPDPQLWDGSGIYGGTWCSDSRNHNKLRHAVVDNIEEFESIINAPAMQKYFPQWDVERLTRVPAGWDKNHPQADLLKLKQFGRFCRLDEKFFLKAGEKWPEAVAERMQAIKPLVDFLNYSLDEE